MVVYLISKMTYLALVEVFEYLIHWNFRLLLLTLEQFIRKIKITNNNTIIYLKSQKMTNDNHKTLTATLARMREFAAPY